MKQTFKAIQTVLGINGISIVKRDGEYNVRIKHSGAGEAYFTTDLMDALQTGLDISRRAGLLVGPDGTPIRSMIRDAVTVAAIQAAVESTLPKKTTLADANALHQKLAWSERPAIRPEYSDSFWASPFKGLTVRAKANQYGNWYGYIGSTKTKYFFGDYIDQQFDAKDWVNLIVNASALATL